MAVKSLHAILSSPTSSLVVRVGFGEDCRATALTVLPKSHRQQLPLDNKGL